MNYLDQLDQMLDADARIVSIETYDPDRVTDLFSQISRFSNKAFYVAYPEQGLHRMGAAHITIPRTQRPSDLLAHINGSKHFGIYILCDFNDALEDKHNVELLKKIATGNTAKVIVLLGQFIDLPEELKPFTMRSKHQTRKAS